MKCYRKLQNKQTCTVYKKRALEKEKGKIQIKYGRPLSSPEESLTPPLKRPSCSVPLERMALVIFQHGKPDKDASTAYRKKTHLSSKKLELSGLSFDVSGFTGL